MTHDILRTIVGRAQALGLIAVEKRRKKASRLGTEVFLHGNGHIHYIIHHLLPILLVVRRSAAKHFVDQGTLKFITTNRLPKQVNNLQDSTSQPLIRGLLPG